MSIEISRNTADSVINKALSKGGDFAEIFCENTIRNNISMVNGAVDKTASGLDYGAGIRVFNGENAVYVYTNDMTEKGLMETAERAAEAVNGQKQAECGKFGEVSYENRNKIKIMPSERKNTEKRDILREASQSAFDYSDKIMQT